MRKFLFSLPILLTLGASTSFAIGRQTEASFEGIERWGDVSVSTSAYTIIGSTTACDDRIAVFFDNYDTNNADMLVIITTSPVAPSDITIGATLDQAAPPWTWPLPCGLYLWAVSLHTSAENLFYEDLK